MPWREEAEGVGIARQSGARASIPRPRAKRARTAEEDGAGDNADGETGAGLDERVREAQVGLRSRHRVGVGASSEGGHGHAWERVGESRQGAEVVRRERDEERGQSDDGRMRRPTRARTVAGAGEVETARAIQSVQALTARRNALLQDEPSRSVGEGPLPLGSPPSGTATGTHLCREDVLGADLLRGRGRTGSRSRHGRCRVTRERCEARDRPRPDLSLSDHLPCWTSRSSLVHVRFALPVRYRTHGGRTLAPSSCPHLSPSSRALSPSLALSSGVRFLTSSLELAGWSVGGEACRKGDRSPCDSRAAVRAASARSALTAACQRSRRSKAPRPDGSTSAA